MLRPKRKLINRLKHKYRLVVMNDASFEEKASIVLTPMNVFIAFSLALVTFTILISSLIIFTPLKEYIPGFANPAMKWEIHRLLHKTDSLENALNVRNLALLNLNDILDGKNPDKMNHLLQEGDTLVGPINLFQVHPEDASLRAEIESQENFDLQVTDSKTSGAGIAGFSFFPPIKGIVTEKFNLPGDHFAVDVVSKRNEPVKAVLDGTVIFASWTPETGHVLGLQHTNNLVSIYKHNSVLLKKVGNFVNSGDAIAVIGNSGELSTGSHLHFELWYNGSAINPEDYIRF